MVLIDTADKRSSAIAVGTPWRGNLPIPDGSINQADRQQAGWSYRGILASIITPDIIVIGGPLPGAHSYLDDSRGGVLVGPPAFIRHSEYDRQMKKKRERDILLAILLLLDD